MRFFMCKLLTLTLVYQLLVQCTSSTVTFEILERLSNLAGHVAINNSLSFYELEEPSPKMHKNVEICVPKFKSLLNATLHSVTVSEEYQHLITEITNLLDQLHANAKENTNANATQALCTSKKMTQKLKFEPFQQYKMYLQKLNRRKEQRRKRTA
ncbi:hypothetical protein NL108_011832 [Boleophthalmus pectinirostris]|nr:hypothetical protein NL108_011832 [Boleophthalmus pectinirostris]